MPANSFRLYPAAEIELGEAARWYEERREGLGVEFLAAVREKISELMDSRDGPGSLA